MVVAPGQELPPRALNLCDVENAETHIILKVLLDVIRTLRSFIMTWCFPLHKSWPLLLFGVVVGVFCWCPRLGLAMGPNCQAEELSLRCFR